MTAPVSDSVPPDSATPSDPANPAAEGVDDTTGTISGKWVVIAMFAMGIMAGVINITYWYLQTGPFRPMMAAIGKEYKHSVPRVEGGRHRKGPLTLRISLRVPFNPETDPSAGEPVIRRLIELARDHQDLKSYEVLEIHLIHIDDLKQGTHREWTFKPSELPDDVKQLTVPPPRVPTATI